MRLFNWPGRGPKGKNSFLPGAVAVFGWSGLILAGFLLASVACGPGCGRRETRGEAAARNKILLFGNGSEPGTLDPGAQAAAIEYTLHSALFEGLVNLAGDGRTIVPGVAETWTISPDQLVYTFHLRRDARWSDGTAVTADDFAFAFRRVVTPSLGCLTSDTGFAILGARALANGANPATEPFGVRAIDPETLEIRLEHRAPYILYVLAGSPWLPVPRAVVDRFGATAQPGNAWARPGNLVGNGPFLLKSWQADANITVVKSPTYWDRAHVRLNGVEFFPIESAEAEERAFRSGDLHLTYRVPLSKLAGYRESHDARLQVTPVLWTWFVVFNTERAPFDRADVRRAFSLVIDRERLTPALLHELGTPAHALTRPGTGGYTPDVPPDYDPVLARTLLAQAGYPGGAGFPEVQFTTRNSGADPLVSEALQQVWQKELGVRVGLAQLEPKVAITTQHGPDYQFGISGYLYAMESPEFILTVARGDSPANMARWHQRDFDRAFGEAERAPTEEQHRAALQAMEGILQREMPYAPLFFYNQCQLLDPRLRGWTGNLLQQTDWRALSFDDAP
jgi:oligopeptide transport system substrate-binding protein